MWTPGSRRRGRTWWRKRSFPTTRSATTRPRSASPTRRERHCRSVIGDGVFIGQHGSWNRRPFSGYKVIFVPFSGGRPAGTAGGCPHRLPQRKGGGARPSGRRCHRPRRRAADGRRCGQCHMAGRAWLQGLRRRNVEVTANAPPSQGPPAASTPGARLGALPRFIIFYALLYAAFGAASPFMPAFLSERGVAPQELGLLLAASTAVRLISGPAAGRLADLFHALRHGAVHLHGGRSHRRAVLSACARLLAAAPHQPRTYRHARPAPRRWPMRWHCEQRRGPSGGFEYGWVRGAGSAAFIVGSLVAGQLVADHRPRRHHRTARARARRRGHGRVDHPGCGQPCARPARTIEAGALEPCCGSPIFVRVVLIAALVLGSHAMHDAFAVIRWSAAGMSAATASVLWSEAVAAEVVVFFVLGPRLLNLIGPAGALALACSAGVLRWVIMGLTANVVAMAMIQPLHGFTFALLASRLHAAPVRLGSARARSHRAGALPHGRSRPCVRRADPAFRLGLRAIRRARLLDHGRDLRARVAGDLEPLAKRCARTLSLTLPSFE